MIDWKKILNLIDQNSLESLTGDERNAILEVTNRRYYVTETGKLQDLQTGENVYNTNVLKKTALDEHINQKKELDTIQNTTKTTEPSLSLRAPTRSRYQLNSSMIIKMLRRNNNFRNVEGEQLTELQKQIDEFIKDVKGDTLTIFQLVCPICGKKQYKVQIPISFTSDTGSSPIFIPKYFTCEHSYIIYVDRNGVVRGHTIKDQIPIDRWNKEFDATAKYTDLYRMIHDLYTDIGKAPTVNEIERVFNNYASKVQKSEITRQIQFDLYLVEPEGDNEDYGTPITLGDYTTTWGRKKNFTKNWGNKEINLKDKLSNLGEKINESKTANQIYNTLKNDTTWKLLSGILGIGLTSEIFGSHVSCMVGLTSLTHVNSIEVAHSGRILKFRASGSVFLAHQEGGKDAIRIEGIIHREEIAYVLISLWFHFLWGNGELIEDFETVTKNYNRSESGLLELRQKMSNAMSYRSDVQKPSYIYHKTFPFVSEHVIIPNTYIETFSFEDRVVDGMNVIKYTILLRTYDKPENITIYEYKGDESDLNFISPQHSYENKGKIMATFVLNAVRRFVQAEGIYFREQAYKDTVLYDKDVYYNIDITDLVATFGMGAMGLKANQIL